MLSITKIASLIWHSMVRADGCHIEVVFPGALWSIFCHESCRPVCHQLVSNGTDECSLYRGVEGCDLRPRFYKIATLVWYRLALNGIRWWLPYMTGILRVAVARRCPQ